MKPSIRNKIFFSFASVSVTIIFTVVILISWQLHKNTAEQSELLALELTSRTFATVEGYHTIALSTLGNVLEEIKKYGLYLSLNSPIAANIERQQNESIVGFLANSAPRAKIDFVLIFNVNGELQASSGGAKGYRPGDLNLPSQLENFKKFPFGQKVNDILKKEISFQISPQESAERVRNTALNGFIWLDREFLNNLGVATEEVSEKGAIALVDSGIIRDDFSVPIGIFIAGKLINNLDSFFNELHEASHVGTFLFIDTTLISFAVFSDEELKENDGSLLELNPAEVTKIHQKILPTNILLSFFQEKYLSSCSSIKDTEQNKIGIFCTGLPESEIAAIQQPLLNHGIETERILQARLVAISAMMILILLILARVLSSAITKPLEQVINFTKEVGVGDLSRRLQNLPNDEIGSLSRSVNTMLDNLDLAIQEKEKAEAHFRQSHKMEAIGILAGGIAHDFNNILTGILGFAELAKCETPLDSKAHKDLEQIIISGKRARDLIKQMLTFSRQEKMERISIPLNIHVKEILKLLRASIPSSIEIRQNIASDCQDILGNPTEIHQLMMNLCSNAAYVMEKEGGILEIGLQDVVLGPDQASSSPKLIPGRYVMLTVKDTGHGIDPSVIDHIFDPFFTTKEVGKGTGMGLAVVHGIVDSYGGVISVDSSPTAGTTFTILFPPAKRKEVSSEAIPVATTLTTGKERILFVDDEVTIITVQKRGLEQLGYSVSTVTSSFEALQLFKSKPDSFDIVITDYSMPQMTGEGLARELHKIRADLPIILCTGYSENVVEAEAKNIGIRRVVLKPVGAADLANIIRKIIDV